MSIFKGGYHRKKIGEGHEFLILVQGKVIQIVFESNGGSYNFFPFELQMGFTLVD